jgi:putative Mg2+ transporter-C (MgtC) family protein
MYNGEMEALHHFITSCPLIDDNLFKIFFAIVIGSVMGLEREYRGRAAGIRTLLLVCVGSTIVMLASDHVADTFLVDGESPIRFDPTRIAAGIVTGIGFLGAGAIIRHQKITIGLTTASLIWFNAGLGILIGLGMYTVTLQATILTLILLILFNWLQRRLDVTLYRDISLLADYDKDILDQARKILLQFHFTISQYGIIRDMETKTIEIKFSVKAHKSQVKLEVLDAWSQTS